MIPPGLVCLCITGARGGFCDWFLPQGRFCVSQTQFSCGYEQCDNVRSSYPQSIFCCCCSHTQQRGTE